MFFNALNIGDNEVLNGQQPTAQDYNYKLFPILPAKLKNTPATWFLELFSLKLLDSDILKDLNMIFGISI